MTRLKKNCPRVAMLLLVTAAGCQADGNDPIQSLAGSPLDALLDQTTSENPASVAGETIALASSPTTTRPIRTLQANEDLGELVESAPGIVLLDFYADWCGPCHRQSKVLHDMEEFASAVNAQIIKVNVDEHRELGFVLKGV